MSGARGIPRWAIAPLFAAVSIALFAPGIFAGKVPVFRDLLVLTIPLRWFAREAVRSGILPLWTDGIFFGAPFLANYQSQVLYPPSALVYGLPFAIGFSLFLAFHVLVAGWGMARYLEDGCGLTRGPAVFGGIVYCLGGFLTSLISLTNQLVVAAWMPWALTAARGLAATGSRRSFLQLTLVIALQALGGAPEALLLTIALIGIAVVGELVGQRTRWTRCLAVCGSLLIAAAISAVQLLPTAEYAAQTDRAAGLPYRVVTAESLAPRSLLQLVVPHTFTEGAPDFVPEGSVPLFWSLYVGIVPLALAMAAMMLHPFALWPLVFWAALLSSFGDNTPLFSLLYDLVPRAVGAFRFPGKFFLVCHFALAVLSAVGLDHVAASRRQAGRVAAILMATLCVLGTAIAVVASFAPRSLLEGFGYALPPTLGSSAQGVLAARLGLMGLRGAALSFAALGVLWSFKRGGMGGRWLLLGIGALTTFDLFSVHEPLLVFTDWQSLLRSRAIRARSFESGERLFHYCTASPPCLPKGATGLGPWSGMLRPGEKVEPYAQTLWATLVPDVPMVYGLGAVAGSDGFSTRMQQDFFRTLALLPRERAVRMLAALGVSRLIGPEPLGSLAGLTEPLEDRDTGNWQYSLSGRSPPAYLAERVFAAPDAVSALEQLADPAFHAGRDAVLMGTSERGTEAESRGEIRSLTIAPAEIRADVALPAPRLWVVSGTWFPGWEATIDGSLAEVVTVNGIQRGVRVPAGNHHVEMHYRPRSLRRGLRISAAALAASVVAALVVSFRWLVNKVGGC